MSRDPGRLRRAWLSLRRRLRPPRILRPTRAGWCFFAIVLGVGFAALNTGNNLLYLVLALLLSFLVLSGLFSESALRGMRVRRRLPRELYAERDNGVWLEVENTKTRVASFAIAIEDLRDEGPDAIVPVGRAFALRVAAGACESRRYALCPEKRGPLRLRGFRISTRFPFGLFHKSRVVECPAEALVFPAIDRVAVWPSEGEGEEESEERFRSVAVGLQVNGLREHAPEDGMRRVHWRSSLRRGQLLVRQCEDERNAEIEVSLAPGSGRHFEASVRRAASEVVAHLEAGLRVGLRTHELRIAADLGAPQRVRLLSHLAQVREGGGAAPAPAEQTPGVAA